MSDLIYPLSICILILLLIFSLLKSYRLSKNIAKEIRLVQDRNSELIQEYELEIQKLRSQNKKLITQIIVGGVCEPVSHAKG